MNAMEKVSRMNSIYIYIIYIDLSMKQLLEGDIGMINRRSIHDDITVLLIDLQRQTI